MQAPPEASFAPMPLRVRGTLETLDVGIKAFKQYFWVLVGWAAIVNGINSIPFVSYFSYFFTPPLMIGAAACCVAAAVRGQRVSFVQCWRFTQPRYWSIVAMHVFAMIVAGVIFGLLIAIGVMVTVGGAYVFGSAPGNLATIGIVICSVLGLIVFGVIATALFAWHTLVGIVACMEDDKRGTNALSRANELLRGQWRPVIGLMMLLSLGVLALWLIIAAAGAFMGGMTAMRDLFNGTPSDPNVLIALVGFFLSSWLVMTFYTPIHYLVMTLVYLDLRVRKEALDIEWTAHQTAPTPSANWDPTPNVSPAYTGPAAQWMPSTVAPPPAHWEHDPTAISAPTQNFPNSPDTAPPQSTLGVNNATAPQPTSNPVPTAVDAITYDTVIAPSNSTVSAHAPDATVLNTNTPDIAVVSPVSDAPPVNTLSNSDEPGTPSETQAVEAVPAPSGSTESPVSEPAKLNGPRW